MAPVSFGVNDDVPILPYHISPWQGQENDFLSGTPEAVLRGDFFCLPFGRKDENISGPNHGNTSGSVWELVDSQTQHGVSRLRITMAGALGAASVTREFFLRDGENVVYDLTSIVRLEGAFPLGHHAVLRTPRKENSLLVSTGEIRYGMTFPGEFADPQQGAQQSLAVGAEFVELENLPSYKDHGVSLDCSRFPARRGCSDMVQVAPAVKRGEPAWTTAVNTEESYLWFSLRDPSLLPSTVVWIENCARQSSPWDGKNCSLGLEDVCSYFDQGTSASRKPNEFSSRGIPTTQSFSSQLVHEVPYIQGAVHVPPEFKHVRTVLCDHGSATFTDCNGLSVTTPVRTGFVFGERAWTRDHP
ncbi:MAG: hypothetical protein ACLQHF_04320 [Terracidiphilus sp.]